ncbi:MAG: STAS/SEC14 domain-containing protein [Myxococcales bacterium]|nr:STAS/SEC14 domain-containing protein [Myxococcales bacterium]
MARHTHYTQEPSLLRTTSGMGYTHVRGGGFVTREMLEQTLEELRRTPPHGRPGGVLFDLRHVSGYETACLRPAHRFLYEARSLGVARIALIAESSFIHAASRMAADDLPVELRAFDHEPSAARWLMPDPGVERFPAAAP